MDATTTHSIHSLIQQLRTLHPNVHFEEAERFSWSPSTHTVFYAPDLPDAKALLLHELGHVLLGHRSYIRDVELLAMETAAWEQAIAYSKSELKSEILLPSMDETVIQDHLDTYRDWLHARSTCPNCTATGYQTNKAQYTCPACSQTWRVNEARLCALRRYTN